MDRFIHITGPYMRWLEVYRAADALRNQAETMVAALHESLDRVIEYHAKLAARAAENS